PQKWLNNALGPRVTAGVVNTVAAMTVGAATLAGVAAAANEDVSFAPVTVVDRVVKTTVSGPELPPTGDPQGTGESTKTPPGPEAIVDQLTVMTAVLQTLSDKIGGPIDDVDESDRSPRDLLAAIRQLDHTTGTVDRSVRG